jgi:hypothetical protein
MSITGKMTAEQARQQRLSRALRENLRRRKAQARGRAQEPKAELTEPPTETTATPPADEAGPGTGGTRLSPQSRPD